MSIISADAAATLTTSGTATEIAHTMAPRRQYRLTARTNGCWYRVVVAGEATNVAAVAGSGSHFLPVNTSVPIAAIGPENLSNGVPNAGMRARVSVIQDVGAGTATLSEVPFVQGT